MRFAPTTLALGLFLASTPLLAGEGSDSSLQYSRRQLADCMLKRMNANRTLSYNDASKACKDQLRGTKTDAALKYSTVRKPVS